MRRTLALLVSLSALLAVGCTAQLIGDAARTSLSSFITTVVTTSVNAAINP